MIIRNGFVSNSSSSSFVIFGRHDVKISQEEDFKEEYFHDWDSGEYRFGWQLKSYFDFNSKLNYLLICAHALETSDNYEYKTSYLDNIKKAVCEIKNAAKFKTNIQHDGKYIMYEDEFKSTPPVPSYEGAYIDHESEYLGEAKEILENIEHIKQFLMNPCSAFVCCNDNEEEEVLNEYLREFNETEIYKENL